MNTALDGARAYSYNEHDRLATEAFDYAEVGMTDFAAAYDYDTAGNHVTTGPDTFHGHSWTPDAYDRSNQFTDANNFGYNHEGDPSLYKGQTLTFDAEHHLTGYGTALTAAALVDGKRAWKQVGNARTFFCYDGDTLIGQQTGTNAQDFVPILSGPGGLIACGDTYYQFDPEGNVVHRTDADGELVTTSVYDAWGVATDVLPNGDPATVTDPFGYKGQAGYYTDHETGLILCTHRYYDPELGRWLTRDPAGYDGGVNLFGYCGEEPVNGVDPSGLATLEQLQDPAIVAKLTNCNINDVAIAIPLIIDGLKKNNALSKNALVALWANIAIEDQFKPKREYGSNNYFDILGYGKVFKGAIYNGRGLYGKKVTPVKLLGNGNRYYGRGYIQITWWFEYYQFSIDSANRARNDGDYSSALIHELIWFQPDLLLLPDLAAESTVWYFLHKPHFKNDVKAGNWRNVRYDVNSGGKLMKEFLTLKDKLLYSH